VMGLGLFLFNHFVDMNLFFGIIEITLGAGIYFSVLILTKGVTIGDWKLIRSLIKK